MKGKLTLGIVGLLGAAMAATVAFSTSAVAAPNINYNIWNLQQPDGTTIKAAQLAGYSSAYFYTSSSSGQVFMCPQTGTTTSGSKHPRSELREVNSNGTNAAWTWDGTNTLTVSAVVRSVGGGTSGRTAIGQVFNSTDSVPLCEVQYTAQPNRNGGNFQLLYAEAKGQGTYIYLSETAPLNTTFTYKISLTNGSLNVYINDVRVYTKRPSYSDKTFYFKCGNYDQTATSGAITTTPYTVVEINSVAVVHK